MYQPVRRRIVWPKLVVDRRRRPNHMKKMINPRFFPFAILLEFGSIAFHGFRIGWFGIHFFLFLREFKKLFPNLLQLAYELVGNSMVDHLEYPPLSARFRYGAHAVFFIRVAQIDGGDFRGWTLKCGDGRLFFLWPDEI